MSWQYRPNRLCLGNTYCQDCAWDWWCDFLLAWELIGAHYASNMVGAEEEGSCK